MANIYGRQVVVPVANKTGGAIIAGDVVIVDTSNDSAFTTTTTARAEVSVGIAQESIANNATGRVLTAGYAALVNVPASVTRGHYIETHTVAKQATGNSTRRSGSFGQFLTGGTTPIAILWGQTDQTASGGSVATDAIFDAKGDLAAGTGADTAAKLTVGANDTILMADSAQSTGLKWVASQTPSTQAFSDAAAEGTADTYARGDHKHAMPASPGGGATYGQAIAYPTSFSGDDDDFASFGNWADVSAFDISAILNSTVGHLAATGASKDRKKRFTLGTTKSGAFDFRWWGVIPDLSYWSGSGDTYVDLALKTSADAHIAGFRFEPQTTPFNYGLYCVAGGSRVTSNHGPFIPRGAPVSLRITRDGSNNCRWYWGVGLGAAPVETFYQTSDSAPYNGSPSGTVARSEILIHTPSGPGSTAEFGMFIDIFQSV